MDAGNQWYTSASAPTPHNRKKPAGTIEVATSTSAVALLSPSCAKRTRSTKINWKRIFEIKRSASKKNVRNEVKCYEGKTWGPYPGNNSLRSYYHCADHANCPVAIKIIAAKDGFYEAWMSDNNHAATTTETFY